VVTEIVVLSILGATLITLLTVIQYYSKDK